MNVLLTLVNKLLLTYLLTFVVIRKEDYVSVSDLLVQQTS